MCYVALVVPDGSDVGYKAIWIERKARNADGVSILPQEITERLAVVRVKRAALDKTSGLGELRSRETALGCDSCEGFRGRA